jgi:hypothetical protein
LEPAFAVAALSAMSSHSQSIRGSGQRITLPQHQQEYLGAARFQSVRPLMLPGRLRLA